MDVLTIDQPLVYSFLKGVENQGWKINLIPLESSSIFTAIDREQSTPSFIFLPMFQHQKNQILCELIDYADLHHIPLLFMIDNQNRLPWSVPLPRHALYDIIHFDRKESDLLIKIRTLLHLNMRLLTAKNREQELEEMQKRIDQELSLAKKVQDFILPSPLNHKNIELNSIFEPSTQLSGDLFFWCEIEPDVYGIFIMDVNGHGIHAALISMSMRSLLPGLLRKVKDPTIIIEELNRHMYKLFKENPIKGLYNFPYFTAIAAIVDTKEKYISYVNAGHPPGMIYHPDTNTVQLLSEGCMPIGLVEKLTIKKETIHYKTGANLLLYTDGLIEAPTKSEMILFNQIKKRFKQVCKVPNKNVLVQILIHRMAHSEITDDICLIHGFLK